MDKGLCAREVVWSCEGRMVTILSYLSLSNICAIVHTAVLCLRFLSEAIQRKQLAVGTAAEQERYRGINSCLGQFLTTS